ncbi:unnamed protein product, partial [Cylicostephanus goldi]
MLLAATHATFKSEFGPVYVEYEKHVTDRKVTKYFDSKVPFDGGLSISSVGPNFRIFRELVENQRGTRTDERKLHNAQQERAAVAHAGPQHMKGVAFPLDRNAEDAVRKLANGSLALVQL